MAGKSKLIYICSQCGFESPKWYGKCPGCGEWNCMEEGLQAPAAVDVRRKSAASVGGGSYRLQDIDTAEDPRYYTGLSELDRVLGGGIVKGSLILISGDPGIGKSTMLLQICEYLGRSLRILYVSGEESVRQIKLRAQRHLLLVFLFRQQRRFLRIGKKTAFHDHRRDRNVLQKVNVFSRFCLPCVIWL